MRTTEAERTRTPSHDGAHGGSPLKSVQVVIEYSEPDHYRLPAERLARALCRDLGVEPLLVSTRGGLFEVTVAGRLVFSKRASTRLPDNDEIFYHVREAQRR